MLFALLLIDLAERLAAAAAVAVRTSTKTEDGNAMMTQKICGGPTARDKSANAESTCLPGLQMYAIQCTDLQLRGGPGASTLAASAVHLKLSFRYGVLRPRNLTNHFRIESSMW